MPKVCNRCNRPISGSKRSHVCPIVLIQEKSSGVVKTVHEDRVAKKGDLHSLVTGKNALWEVVFRNRQKIEKKIEERQQKKSGKVLVPPSGELLVPPKG